MSVKAFELVPAIERINLLSEKASTQIVCLECCGKNLYFGTDDCFVIHYLIDERSSPNGRVQFVSEKQGHKHLGLKKPVVQLKAASAINRIFVLCDATLSLLNMLNLEPVLSGAKVKGISAFCLNENPIKSSPFSVEICVAHRRSIQLYTVCEDRVIAVKDVSVAESPLTLSIDGVYVCVAYSSEYKIINMDTGHVQDLFSFDSGHVLPTITKISREEYLLNATSALGVFAQVKGGASLRPPLQWSNNVTHVVFTHPYILTLNDEFITVHSILDQQQKQTIPFSGGRYMGEFDGRVFVATSPDVYYLLAVPVEKQIQSLLNDRRVSEALELARGVHKTGLSKEKFTAMCRRIEQQAGFVEFSQLHFSEARELFLQGRLDVRELITLYPGLMPSNSTFTRAVPPLHDIADVAQLCRGDTVKIQQCKKFLLDYLRHVSTTSSSADSQPPEVDVALLKLYAEADSSDLVTTIVSCCSHLSDAGIADCADWLNKCGRHHAVGLLHHFHGDDAAALDVWTRIVSGELKDRSFPGLQFIVEFLANCQNCDLVWKYADWILELNEVLGVQIFTERKDADPFDDRLKPDIIVDYLSKFSEAVIVYLEFLVFTKKLEKELYHTHLAVRYLDSVLSLRKSAGADMNKLEHARLKLRRLLQESNLYRPQLLLGKIKDTDLYAECAILYGKLGEHERALRLLVHKLRDFPAAENYCLINTLESDVAERARLFHMLLSVYLDPNNERRELYVAPAVSLLNNNRAEFDTSKVLQCIPDNWSLGLIHQFLTSSVRKTLNRSRTTRVERMLLRGDNLAMRLQTFVLTRDPFYMTEDRICGVCNRGFSEASFLRYPNGVVAHIHCANASNVSSSSLSVNSRSALTR